MQFSSPLLLDGGLSNQLEKQGHALHHPLWTANLLATNPEAIIQAHLAYLEAGAQLIITASYQASFAGFRKMGYSQAKAEAFIKLSVELAAEAIQRYMADRDGETKPLIAASIGPFGAALADGSEYHGNYGVSDKTLFDFHFERINILAQTEADFFACETIPSLQEANVLATILTQTQKPVWISFSCKDERHLNDGTDIRTAVALFADHPQVFAVGVNCTAPQYISGLIQAIKTASGTKKIVVYPNSGEAYHAASKTWIGISDPDLFVGMAREWLASGADILGGCCRIGPDHISRIRDLLESN